MYKRCICIPDIAISENFIRNSMDVNLLLDTRRRHHSSAVKAIQASMYIVMLSTLRCSGFFPSSHSKTKTTDNSLCFHKRMSSKLARKYCVCYRQHFVLPEIALQKSTRGRIKAINRRTKIADIPKACTSVMMENIAARYFEDNWEQGNSYYSASPPSLNCVKTGHVKESATYGHPNESVSNYVSEVDQYKETSLEGNGKQRTFEDVLRDRQKQRIYRGSNRIEHGRTIVSKDAPSGSSNDASSRRIANRGTSNALKLAGGRIRAKIKETGKDSLGQYLKEIVDHDLLSLEDELVLGREIQLLSKLQDTRLHLEKKLARAANIVEWSNAAGKTVDEMREQFRRSQLAKSALIEANLRLVVSNVRKILKFRTSKVDFADAFQDGIIGLSKACEKFDPKKGVRFATYANFWIKREVRRSVQTQQNVMRVPHHAVEKINRIKIAELILRDKLGHMPDDTDIAEHLGMQVEHFIFYRNAAREVMSVDSELKSGKRKGSAASGGGVGGGGFTLHSMLKDPEDTPLDNAGKRMLEHDVRRLIRTLSPREQAVIRLRFGLDDGLPQTLDSIAQLFSTNRDQVHRVEVEALAKLRQPYRCKSVQAYVSDLV